MKFVDDIKKEDYIKFWESHKNSHFLNAYFWGNANKIQRNQDPVFVGLIDDKNKLLCATLLLKRTTPLNMCYYYAPRGFIIDWDDKKLVEKFTEELKNYLKKTNAIYLKVDPGIEYQDIDEEANPINGGNNNYKLFDYLISLGYKHQGFNKLYEKNNPRYTFRTYFKNYPTFEDVEKTISKTFMRSIKRSYNYNLKISLENNVDNLYDLISLISKKDGFSPYTKEYYESIFNSFNEYGYIKNYVAKINPKEVIASFEKMLTKEKNSDRITKLNKDIEFLKTKIRKDEKEFVIASLVCTYTKYGAWSLYVGNDDVAEYTGCVNRLYYEFMRDAYNDKKEFADLFGTIGDPHSKFKNLSGIYEYKKKLGGKYVEFMGEFDLINKPFWYKVLPILLNIYRKFKKMIKRH